MLDKCRELLKIFLIFFKIGLITFGGGYVMISIIENNIVEKYKWFGQEEFIQTITIAQSLPGPFSITTATFFGYKRAGILGSFSAVFGVVLPSFITILLISVFIHQFKSFKFIQSFLKGIQAGVSVLVFRAGIKLSKNLKITFYNIFLFITTLVLAFIFKVNLINILLVFLILSYSITIYKLWEVPYELS